MRRRSTVALLAALIVMAMTLGASAAFAGEVKGPPGPLGAEGGATPVADFWGGDAAASICSFSGLNDEITDFEPTQTQSYGTFIVLYGKDFVDNGPDGPPGLACNPTKGPNPKGVGH
jgi:hypothetical protein